MNHKIDYLILIKILYYIKSLFDDELYIGDVFFIRFYEMY